MFAAAGNALGETDAVSAATFPGPDWDTTTPAEAGMDVALLRHARSYALAGGGSGIIVRGGKRVFSWGDQEVRYTVKSVTKSIGVTALGLALQDGLLDLSDPAQTHLPGVGVPPASNGDSGWLDDITVRQLANHTAGFDKTGGYIPLLFQPGSTWAYSDGGANWLADLLTIRFGADLRTIMSARVFQPLGITSADLTWRQHRYREETLGGIKRREFGSGVGVNVDAMARIGYLYLRGGYWNGLGILPPAFIEMASTADDSLENLRVHKPTDFPAASNHYGLLWWNNNDKTLAQVPADAYWAWGLGDNLIVVIPSLDLVVARAGAGWRPGWNADYSVVEPFLGYIVKSISDASPSEFRLFATKDTFSNKSSPNANTGSRKILRAQGPNEKKIAFIDFDVAGVSGPVDTASLELSVKRVVAGGTLEARPVFAAWSESTLTHANKPAIGNTVATIVVKPSDVGLTVSLNVTELARQWVSVPNSGFGIALTSSNGDLQIGSRESADAPVLSITSGNLKGEPFASISEPADGAAVNEAELILFAGSASDAEDGTVTNGLAWRSDRDGIIGSGGTFSTSTLSPGTHRIHASVTDSSGITGATDILLSVR